MCINYTYILTLNLATTLISQDEETIITHLNFYNNLL